MSNLLTRFLLIVALALLSGCGGGDAAGDVKPVDTGAGGADDNGGAVDPGTPEVQYTVTQSQLAMDVSERTHVNALADGNPMPAVWVVDVPNIVQLQAQRDGSVDVVAMSAGKVVITARFGGVERRVAVTVNKPKDDARLVLAPALELDMMVGQQQQWFAMQRTGSGTSMGVSDLASWRVTNTSIATIKADGLLTALKPGDTDVVVAYGGVETRASVHVKDANVCATVSNNLTLHFKKPSSWSAVYVYLWRGSGGQDPSGKGEPAGKWPGTRLTETDGWFAYQVVSDALDNGEAKFIFNGGQGGAQTANLSINQSGWYDGDKNAWVDAPSTCNGNDAEAPRHALSVDGGMGSGQYALGKLVIVTADVPAGKTFVGWRGAIEYLKDPSSKTSLLVMPAEAIDISAQFQTARDPEAERIKRGKAHYVAECASCHGDDGSGSAITQIDLSSCPTCTATKLSPRIAKTMPPSDPGSCSGDCAADVAAYILSTFQSSNSDGQACAADDYVPGTRQLRLLTASEFRNTVRDLIGGDFDSKVEFPAEVKPNGYDNDGPAREVTSMHIEKHIQAAKQVADVVVQKLNSLFTCNWQSSAASCQRNFINHFGAKVFRRPLTDVEVARYLPLYAGHTINEGVALVVQGLLVSPHFWYRSEIGAPTGDGRFRLTPSEIATFLSYTFTESMPDAALTDAASQGKLSTPAQILEQSRRLLADSRSRDAVTHFGLQWLGADRVLDAEKDDPAWTTDIRAAMLEETKRFFAYVTFDSSHRFDELFNANYTFVNPTLASWYGITMPTTGNGFAKANYAGRDRIGLLGQGSLLAGRAKSYRSSPTARGLLIRERVLCDTLPPAPALVNTNLPRDDNRTTRQLMETHVTNETCYGCHQYTDMIGFGLEHFDELGRYRATEKQQSIDSNGEIRYQKTTATRVNRLFSNAVALGNLLSTEEMTRSCFVTQYTRFAQGRRETADDQCNLRFLGDRFAAKQYDMQALMLEYTQSPTFTLRQ